MKTPYGKLAATIVFLLVAMSLIVVGSYAWMTASRSPVAEGIQITVSGGQTILLASDVTSVGDDGTVHHYPGSFSDKLNLSQLLDLDALNGLIPVSTADGLHWYLPAYYTAADDEVKNHVAALGSLKPVTSFETDTALTYANLAADAQSGHGSYLYVDFWVVSPGSRYDLRVATSDDEGVGSYVVGLQDVVSDGAGGYRLADAACAAAESVRIGFLANQDEVEAATLQAYQSSRTRDTRYSQLRGIYQEKGQDLSEFYYALNSFSIYEPNGDSHSAWPELGHSYVITRPVGDDNGAREMDVSSRLSVQLSNTWKSTVEGIFQAAALQAASHGSADSAAALQSYFYYNYLEGQTSPYVEKGSFIDNTADIYTASTYQSGVGYTVPGAALAELSRAGACSSNRIAVLEKNIPQRIRMFIWLEGQDIDCANGVKADTFAMSIELAGSSHS